MVVSKILLASGSNAWGICLRFTVLALSWISDMPSHSVSVIRHHVSDILKQKLNMKRFAPSSSGHLGKKINKGLTTPANQNRIDWLRGEAGAVASSYLVGINQRPKGCLLFRAQPFFSVCVSALLGASAYFYTEILVGWLVG